MLQRQGQRLRRLANLIGCRDAGYSEPELSKSATPSDHEAHLDDETTSTAHLEDEGVVTQEV